MKVRDILLIGAFCLLLCGPALVMACNLAKIEIPSWLSPENARTLTGSYRSVDFDNLALSGFLDGSLQSEAELAIEDHVPAKSTALLTWSFAQRCAIAISNELFGWQCYPVFYGSEVLLAPQERRLLEMPETSVETYLAQVDSVSTRLSSFCERHSDLEVYVYLAADSVIVEGSPAGDLVSHPVSYSNIAEAFAQEGFTWVDGGVSYEEFLEGWYATDHHWSIVGAFAAYKKIAEAMGDASAAIFDQEKRLYVGPPFRGTLARRGLISEYADNVVDYEVPSILSFSVRVDGDEVDPSFISDLEAYKEGAWLKEPFANHYAELFHYDWGLVTLDNKENTSGNNLLVVSDSYSNCIEPFLAAQFDTSYFLDPRFASETVDEFLQQYEGVRNVVFLMRQTNLFSEDTINVLR